MSAVKAVVGAVALVLSSAAPIAGAVTHPQLSPVRYSAHDVVVQAAKRIHLDRPASSMKDGEKNCRKECAYRKRKAPNE